MSYLADFKQVYDKPCISESHDVFIIYFHFLNTNVQVLAPRGGTFSDELHEPLWATNNGDFGHSLGDLGEMMTPHGVIHQHQPSYTFSKHARRMGQQTSVGENACHIIFYGS